jgi:RND family efflux transporter MFP subunit
VSSRSEAPSHSIAEREWGRLSGAASNEEFFAAWLAVAGNALAADRGVLVARSGDSERFAPAAFYPEGQPCGPFLADAAERALYDRRPLTLADGGRLGVAYPVQVQGRMEAIAAFEWDRAPGDSRESLVRKLQWGLPWIEARLAGVAASLPRADADPVLLRAIQAVLSSKSFVDAARAAATELAQLFACERVSIGVAADGPFALAAISNTAQFDHRLALPRAIEALMEEARGQTGPLLRPAPDTPGHALCVVSGLFAVCLERQAPFETGVVAEVQSACAALAPALGLQHENDLPLRRKAGRRLAEAWRHWFGAHAGRRRYAAIAALLLLAVLAFAKGEFRVTGDAALEGSVRRVMTAPFDGYVLASQARAGDRVAQGAPIAALDDRDLRLERVRWASQHAQYARQLQEASAKHERGQMQIVQAQMAQAEAQVQLLDEQLRRARITAPFDGLIVNGDLSQSVGGAVRKGDTLFEVTPLSGYRVVVQVEESEIGAVAAGQKGTLLLAAIASQSFPITVTAVTPVAKARDGRNAFRVEASLEGPVERLRPGMEGIAKIETGSRNLVWIWTHRFTNWLRLKAWSLWP